MTKLFKNNFILLGFIWLVGFFVYAFMIQPNFKTLDDIAGIVNNPMIRDFHKLNEIFSTSYFGGNSYYRPLVYVTYMMEYHLFGLQAQYFYVVNILFHLLSATVIFLIGQKLLKRTVLSFVLSLLFAIHPVHWEAVSNIPGRSILLCGLFYFLSFYSYLCARDMRQKRFCILSLIFFVLSLLSKESGITLPILVFFHGWIVRKEFFKQIPTMVSYFLVAFGYMFVRHALGITSVFKWRSVAEATLGVLTFLKSVFIHWSLLIFPRELYFDRSLKLFNSFNDPQVIGVVCIFVLLGLIIFLKRKAIGPIALFGIVWFFVDLLPVSQIIANIGTQPGYISTADHFLYTPSVGFFIFGIVLWSQWIHNTKFCSKELERFIVTAYLIFLSCVTIGQNIYSSHEMAMLEHTFKHNPNNARMRESYGFALAREQKYEEAIEEFQKVLTLNPTSTRARIALGKALCDVGRCVQGALEYDKVRDAGNLQELLDENKKLTYAIVITQYQTRIASEPNNADLHYSLGVFYLKSQRIDEAIDEFKKALELNPDHANARFNLVSSLRAIGQAQQAEVYEAGPQ